jgi:hypothetical protein
VSSTLWGILLVLGITIIAGIIAYIGDRVGHQVGRKRLTLFGLRPKYTSTIVAVGTGMLIALSVTLIAIFASNLVRTAFFRLGQINARIAELEAQEIKLQQEVRTTRETPIVVPGGTPVANVQPLVINPAQPDNVLMPELSSLFEQTAAQVNRQFPAGQYPLKPYTKRVSETEIQTKLKAELKNIRDDVAGQHLPNDTPVLLVPVIGQNLFAGDSLTFSFFDKPDLRVAAAGETLASLPVQGGTSINLLTLQRLTTDATLAAVRRGMPAGFATNVAINGPQAQAALAQVPRLRGKYRLAAKSTIDLYPHSGGVLLDIALVPAS